jgi:hypothetical protein
MTILKLLAWTGVSVVLAAGQPESGPGTGENICGTNRGLRCPDGQYCDLGVGQCQVADAQGVCKAKRTSCTKEFKPRLRLRWQDLRQRLRGRRCGCLDRSRRGVREGAWFLGVHATALEPACAHRWEPGPGGGLERPTGAPCGWLKTVIPWLSARR